MTPQEFFDLAKGTKLENYPSFLFNLLFVYKGIRPACTEYSDEVLKVYPFFKISKKFGIPFTHIKPLPKYEGNKSRKSREIWIGNALGYKSPGELAILNPIAYSLKVEILFHKNNKFVTEVVHHEISWTNNFDKKKIDDMVKLIKVLNYVPQVRIDEINHCNKLYVMNIQEKYFKQIESEEKTFELRLYDEKRQKIEKGDIIEFKCGNESFRYLVKSIEVYNTFEEALKKCKLKNCLPDDKTYQEGVEVYHAIPGYKEGEKKYGVCAIELTRYRSYIW